MGVISHYNGKMKVLLLIAHGSRVESANDEVRLLAERVSYVSRDCFDMVRYAFLELAEPSIARGLRQCVEAGADEVFVVPYFLAAGKHIVEDIPAQLQQQRGEHPGVGIYLCDYLGKSRMMADLLLQLAEKNLGERRS